MMISDNYNDLKIQEYISNKDILNKISDIADAITSDFKSLASNTNPLYTICVLKGAVLFYSELIQKINLPLNTNFITLSSYGNNFKSSGKVSLVSENIPDLNGKNVLIVEDLIDTGLTLDYFTKYIKEKYSPASVKVAVLLNKKREKNTEFKPDYFGFEVDDRFIVGFGMDYKGLYRNLDYIGYVD